MTHNKVVVAMNSFKGCLSSAEANEAVKVGIERIGYDNVTTMSMSDGGDGFLDAVMPLTGGERITVSVHDPLMRLIEAEYLRAGNTAYIESARACGLTLVGACERDIMSATSMGVGELIVHAINAGARRVVVGLGGSATCDNGIGMLTAMGVQVTDERINLDDFILNNHDVEFVAASDVTAPLCGTYGAARVFAAQKGATTAEVEILEQRALHFARRTAARLGRDCSDRAGAGAAGGMGFALTAYCLAQLTSGAELLLDLTDWSNVIKDALCVFTGEGCADRQTMMGKLPYIVARRTKLAGVARVIPVILLAGQVSYREVSEERPFDMVECINPDSMSLDECLQPEVAQHNIATAAERVMRHPEYLVRILSKSCQPIND